MMHGTTLRDLCVRFNPHLLKIDERKLVQYGLLHGLIRRIHKVCLWQLQFTFKWLLNLFLNFSIQYVLGPVIALNCK